MKTVISHIYNEEYLLPWWLNHHKNFFDHGIIIDYASTDNSLDIIRQICPTWEIHQSRNEYFSAKEIDLEVAEYENFILDGNWRIILNTTEFLIGDFSKLGSNLNQNLIPCFYFIDNNFDRLNISYDIKLWEDLKYGIDISDSMVIRRARSFHNYKIEYPLGRHFSEYNTEDFIIFNYGYAPMTYQFKLRKLQIQTKIPIDDVKQGLANGHSNYGNGLDMESLKIFYDQYKLQCVDLSGKMEKYLNLMGN